MSSGPVLVRVEDPEAMREALETAQVWLNQSSARPDRSVEQLQQLIDQLPEGF